jgi:hypothetical protein
MTKRNSINILILLSLGLIYFFQFKLINNYLTEVYKYTSIENLMRILNDEKQNYINYILENNITLFLQSLGLLICLNIGFLYFNYKIKIKKSLSLIVKTFLAVIIVQSIILFYAMISDKVLTTNTISFLYQTTSISHFINLPNKFSWLNLSLTTINLTQLLTIIILILGIQKILKCSLKKAINITSKTYGIGFILWFAFAAIMEMNFS